MIKSVVITNTTHALLSLCPSAITASVTDRSIPTYIHPFQFLFTIVYIPFGQLPSKAAPQSSSSLVSLSILGRVFLGPLGPLGFLGNSWHFLVFSKYLG